MQPRFSTMRVLIVVIIHTSIECLAFAGVSPDTSRSSTNVEIFQTLIQRTTGKIIVQAQLSTVNSINLQLEPAPESWIAETAMISKLKSEGFSLFRNDDQNIKTKINFKVATIEYHVQYAEMFRDGFLGNKMVTRIASTTIGSEIINNSTQEILLSGIFQERMSDTVDVDDIPAVELKSAPSTHADLPHEAFIDRIVEPFIILGATGVAVYLFFYVRTQ